MTAGPTTSDVREEAMRSVQEVATDSARDEGVKRGFVERLMGKEMHLAVGIAAGIFLGAGYVLWKWGTWGASATVGVGGLHGLAANAGVGLCWASLGLGSIHGVRAAWKSLKKYKPDIDVLMVVGAFLSAAIGHVEEGALLLVMFTIAGALEERALARTRDAVTRLSKLMPTSALKRERGEWVNVEPEKLSAGDVVLVRPGELVPADGVVEQGRSSVDQSMLTGESFPRTVTEGEQVFAGTMNHAGALEVRVTRRVEESSLKRILELVTEAQETRRPLQRMVDRLSTPYTLVVMLGSVMSFVVFWKLWPAMSAVDAIYRSITLLVVASPCALVLATPTATLCGLSRAARAGVLVKGGDALERLARVEHIALDKTGTLTTGQIEVHEVRMFGRVREEEMLGIARSAEEQSTHPIAKAIVREAKRRGAQRIAVRELTNVEGNGVEGMVEGERVRIGAPAFCEELIEGSQVRDARLEVERIGEQAEKAVVMAYRGSAMVFALADEVRAGADQLAGQLHEAGVKSITMLSGDSQEIAEHVGKGLGIDDVRGGLLPEGKVAEIQRLRKEFKSPGKGLKRRGIAVVGDGVNDAPALAAADVGLAMGSIGADAALETADVILLRDDVLLVPWSLQLAMRVRSITAANLVIAVSVIAVMACLSSAGFVSLPIGVVLHEGSTLVVVANSLRLLGESPAIARMKARDHGRD